MLTTERLFVREFKVDDWKDVYEMNTSAEVMKSIGNGQIKTIEEEKNGFENILLSYEKNSRLGIWAVTLKTDGTLIGAASMTILDGTNEIQIGYRFKKEYWGQGYATEVTKGLLDYGFDHLKLKRIVATANLTNDRSRRVLEKAGLKFERTGTFYDLEMNYFAMTAPSEQNTI